MSPRKKQTLVLTGCVPWLFSASLAWGPSRPKGEEHPVPRSMLAIAAVTLSHHAPRKLLGLSLFFAHSRTSWRGPWSVAPDQWPGSCSFLSLHRGGGNRRPGVILGRECWNRARVGGGGGRKSNVESAPPPLLGQESAFWGRCGLFEAVRIGDKWPCEGQLRAGRSKGPQ